jgi:CubicO group peptidase (beta-lactamase class C family)
MKGSHGAQEALERRLRIGLAGVPHGGASLAVLRGTSEVALAIPGGVHHSSAQSVVPDEDTLFHLCSCSKAFLSLTFAKLVSMGITSWDDPIVGLIPEMALPDELAKSHCTYRDLASMRTGISREGIAEWGIDQTFSKARRISRTRHMKMSAGFRETFSYSNLGYIALGLAVERLTGRPLHDVQRELLFEPIGMTGVWSGLSSSDVPGNLNRPCVPVNGHPTQVDELTGQNSQGSARIHASAHGAISWLKFLLDIAGKRGNHRSMAAMAEVFAPQTSIKDVDLRWSPERAKCDYGLGFFISELAGHRLLHHGGGGRGWRTQCLIVPEADTALLLMVSAESARIDGLAFDLMDFLLDVAPRNWTRLMEEESVRRATSMQTQIASQFPVDKDGSIGEVIATGCYANKLTGAVTISEGENGLMLKFEDAPIFDSHLIPAANGTLIMSIDTPALKPQPLDPLFRLRAATDSAYALDSTYFGRLYRCS